MQVNQGPRRLQETPEQSFATDQVATSPCQKAEEHSPMMKQRLQLGFQARALLVFPTGAGLASGLLLPAI